MTCACARTPWKSNPTRINPPSSALSSSNSSSTNSSGYVNGTRSGERTSIPVHQNNISLNCPQSTDSVDGSLPRATSTLSGRSNRGAKNHGCPVFQTNSTRIRSPNTNNAAPLASTNAGTVRSQTAGPSVTGTSSSTSVSVTDSQSNANRGRTYSRGTTEIARRHFTRRLAPNSSTGNSTVSDGELEKTRTEIPPALPRLSVDRIALTPPATVFDRASRPSQLRPVSSMPIPRTGLRSTTYRPQGSVSSQDDSPTGSTNVNVNSRYPTHQITGQVVNSNHPTGPVLRLQPQGIDHPRTPPSSSVGRSQPTTRPNAPLIWPSGSVSPSSYHHQQQHPHPHYQGQVDVTTTTTTTVGCQPGGYSSSPALTRPSFKTTTGSVNQDSFGSSASNAQITMIPGPAGYMHGTSEVNTGSYAALSLPGPGTLTTFAPGADHAPAPLHANQPRPPSRLNNSYPTNQLTAGQSQPLMHHPSTQPPSWPARNQSGLSSQNSAVTTVPNPFVTPAVHRPAGQFHPIPPTRQQSLLRTQMLNAPVPGSIVSDDEPNPIAHTDPNVPRQNNLASQTAMSADVSKDTYGSVMLAQQNAKINNLMPPSSVAHDTVSRNQPANQNITAAITPGLERYAINSNQILKSPSGTRKSSNIQAEQRQRARELYAALKHRHPIGSDVGTSSKVPVSLDTTDTKWSRKPLSRRSTTNGSVGLSTVSPIRDESRQANGATQPDIPSSSGAATLNVNNASATGSLSGSVTSEQLAKMLQNGDPQVRSYLQAYVRRPGTNGPPTPQQLVPPPPPPPLSSTSFCASSNQTDQNNFIQTRTESKKPVTNLPDWGLLDDAGRAGCSLDARRRRRPVLGEDAQSAIIDPLSASLSASLSTTTSAFPTRTTESAASSLPRHLRLSMLGPIPDAPGITSHATNRRLPAPIQSDVEPPDSPDLNAYAKRMQERMKEGLRAAQESLWVSTQSRNGSLVTAPKSRNHSTGYTSESNRSDTMSELVTGPRPMSATGVNSRSTVGDRFFGESKNGACSDVEDLMDQAKRRMLPLLDGQGELNRRDAKAAFNSSSDTEDLFTTVSRLHRSAGMHFGYTLPGSKASWTNGRACVTGTGGGAFSDRTSFNDLFGRISGQNACDGDLGQLSSLNPSALPSWSRAGASSRRNGADGKSPEPVDDVDRIYGIVPWSAASMCRSRPFQSNAHSAQRSPVPGPPDGTASAPPGTPIKLPYAAPSTLFAAAMVRPEFAHLFGKFFRF
ncbi:unnamed protein product [Echinostoma caproni]|uniref:RING-type domain-containing protein n=1 Tax=Echinostoma caproni TaxID=27848 RepID=A0A183AI95_9TREM|nr:unnamed protein product [Echinostoma caproni]